MRDGGRKGIIAVSRKMETSGNYENYCKSKITNIAKECEKALNLLQNDEFCDNLRV